MWRPGSWFAAEGGSRGARHLTQQLPNIKCQREDGVQCPELQPETASSGPVYTSNPLQQLAYPPTHLPSAPFTSWATSHPGNTSAPSTQCIPAPVRTDAQCLPSSPTSWVSASHLAYPKPTPHLGHLWLCPHPSHQVYSFLTPDCRPVHSAPVTSHRNFSQPTWPQLPTPTLTDQQPAALIPHPPIPCFIHQSHCVHVHLHLGSEKCALANPSRLVQESF